MLFEKARMDITLPRHSKCTFFSSVLQLTCLPAVLSFSLSQSLAWKNLEVIVLFIRGF